MSLREQIDQTSEAMAKRLDVKAGELAKILAYWMKKSPPGEGEDMVQVISIAWLEQNPPNGGLAFAMARHEVSERWKRIYTRKRKDALSLDVAINDDTGATASDFIADVVNYEAMTISEMDARTVWNRLPKWIQEIVQLRLNGERVNGWRSRNMKEWAGKHGHILIATS